jgi:hypothetical protein
MSQSISQFGITYNADQDRLLFSVFMADKSEILLWLTRNFTRALFGKIVDSMHHRPELERIQQPEIKEAAINMSHQEAVSKTQFVKRPAAEAGNPKSRTGPFVIKSGSLTSQENGRSTLKLKAINGSSISLVLDKQLMHSFCHLLITNSEKATWDLNLSVGDSTAISATDAKIH